MMSLSPKEITSILSIISEESVNNTSFENLAHTFHEAFQKHDHFKVGTFLAEKDEQDARERAQAKEEPTVNVPYPEQWGGQADTIQPVVDDWGADTTPAGNAALIKPGGFGATTTDWSTGGDTAATDDWAAASAAPPPPPPATEQPKPAPTQDWAADTTPATQDWAAPAPSSDWGGAVSKDWTT